MTELSIRPEDVRSAIEQYVTSYTAETTREEVGTVNEVGDGIARVEGLYSTMANELLEAKIERLETSRPLAPRRSRR